MTSEEFVASMRELAPYCKGERFAVAVSGGSDSMALCLLANDWAKEHHCSIVGLTVDHGFREESANEAQTVKKWLTERSIEHRILKWKGKKPVSGIQAAAREERYRLLTGWCRENSVSCLFIAHHMNDQAETFLMRLARGSGVDGLSSMASVVENSGVYLLRPLLSVSHEVLEATNDRYSQEWIEDPSNKNTAYSRVKMRKLLPVLEAEGISIKCLADTAARMRRARASLEKTVSELLSESVVLHLAGYADVDVERLFLASEEICMRALVRVLLCVGGGVYPPRFERLERLYNAVRSKNFSGYTFCGCVIKPAKDGKLIVFRELSATAPAMAIEANKKIIWDGRFTIETNMIGDKSYYVAALGEKGWADIVSEKPDLRKVDIPSIIKLTLPAIFDEQGVLAVPYIEYERIKDISIACSMVFPVNQLLPVVL